METRPTLKKKGGFIFPLSGQASLQATSPASQTPVGLLVSQPDESTDVSRCFRLAPGLLTTHRHLALVLSAGSAFLCGHQPYPLLSPDPYPLCQLENLIRQPNFLSTSVSLFLAQSPNLVSPQGHLDKSLAAFFVCLLTIYSLCSFWHQGMNYS